MPQVTDYLMLVADRKAAVLGLSALEYIAGVVEGRFPHITAKELDAAAAEVEAIEVDEVIARPPGRVPG